MLGDQGSGACGDQNEPRPYFSAVGKLDRIAILKFGMGMNDVNARGFERTDIGLAQAFDLHILVGN